MKKTFFLFIINFISILPVFAEDELIQNSEDINNALSHNSYSPNYLSLFLGLFLVICLIYLTGFLYQKLIKIKLSKDVENKSINIISTASLGQGKNLHIIKVQDKYMLIASSQNNISFLKDLENEPILEAKNEQS